MVAAILFLLFSLLPNTIFLLQRICFSPPTSIQLPDSTNIINSLPENFDQKPNQPKDENNADDNDSNSTAKTAVVDGNDDNNDRSNSCTDRDLVLDVSRKSVEFSILGDLKESVDGIYLYKNVFNLIPKSVGVLSQLRNMKFFGNEINLFPSEVGGLVGLECLQIKIPSLGFNGMSLSKLKGLYNYVFSKRENERKFFVK
ncbi:hypothetical protein J1N35_004029 [Gossypium stocksii]|uniref:Uncharacterized protein n=1 Tax=Gossypium stocksii TaxID=47602 RepID=A0A9D3WAB6_9ROSI|nr:hypothetical protein J1N35_004029 [Gossypium stocksii]